MPVQQKLNYSSAFNSASMKGQVILMALAMLGGAIFASVAVVGYLVRVQLRQAADVVHSTKAIYAADAALEMARYDMLKCIAPSSQGGKTSGGQGPGQCFNDGSKSSLIVGDTTASTIAGWVNSSDYSQGYKIKAQGIFIRSSRAFEEVRK